MQEVTRRAVPASLAIVVALGVTGCELVEGVFKAGVWLGVIIVALVAAIIAGTVAFVRKRFGGSRGAA